MRVRKSRLLVSIVIASVFFWFILYWNFTHLYAKHKERRLQPESMDALPPGLEERDIYSELYLENLAKILTADDQRNYDAGYHNHAFNQMLSDKLSYVRPLPDVRVQKCRSKMEEYPSDLPHASVVICFYNEAMSALLRTVHTVLERSPDHLIHEIILVDDFSTFNHLKEELQSYIDKNLPKVNLVRSDDRLGLIRARLLGASHASGEVLLFLDSHCEVNAGWLEPMLAVIHGNPQTIAVPIMDIVDADSFFYEPSGLVKGGFNWGMHYQWDPLPSLQSRKVLSSPDPYESPTMAGGLFAIDRSYFHSIGEYDRGMDIWGGENLELSFRVWQCGGRLVIVPCSRVGHIFRKRRPYGTPVQDSFIKNTLRMVHVWLDDYKRYYFHINPRAEDVNFGNITSRLQLRKNLNCKSFQWYLENVYPEQLTKLPDLDKPLNENKRKAKYESQAKTVVRAKGMLKHEGSGLCVESEKTIYDKRALLRLGVCKPSDPNQVWFETEQKDFRLANLLCLDYDPDEAPYVRLMKCKGSNTQTWLWSRVGSKSQLNNYGTPKCLVSTGVDPGALLRASHCGDSPFMQFKLV